MKKFLFLLLSALIGTGLSSCNNNREVKIIAPNGTPALGLANFYYDHQDEYDVFDVKEGSDALVAAFTSEDYDIIVAPTNLGAKFYNENQKYVLYQTIVWGNLYLATTDTTIESFVDLNNKDVTLFGKNSTPDIIMKSLVKHYNININLNYVEDVSTANALLKTNKCQTIVSAQPSLSKIASTIEGLKVIDLQNEFSLVSQKGSYPQASIFVKSSEKDNLKDVLLHMTESVNKSISEIEITAENAVNMYSSFTKLGKECLIKAIPNCHFSIETNQKELIEYYFNTMIELGFSKQIGEKLPDENFYFSF